MLSFPGLLTLGNAVCQLGSEREEREGIEGRLGGLVGGASCVVPSVVHLAWSFICRLGRDETFSISCVFVVLDVVSPDVLISVVGDVASLLLTSFSPFGWLDSEADPSRRRG